jgi:predicted DNA-binding protein (UPF0251 family)
MVKRIEYNVLTGEQTEIELTAEEIAEAKRLSDVADAEQAEIQASTKTLADQILESPTELAKLKAALGL